MSDYSIHCLDCPVPRRYLGDGLYAVLRHGMIELRANDIDHLSDTVFLEESVLRSLIEFAKEQKFGGLT